MCNVGQRPQFALVTRLIGCDAGVILLLVRSTVQA